MSRALIASEKAKFFVELETQPTGPKPRIPQDQPHGRDRFTRKWGLKRSMIFLQRTEKGYRQSEEGLMDGFGAVRDYGHPRVRI